MWMEAMPRRRRLRPCSPQGVVGRRVGGRRAAASAGGGGDCEYEKARGWTKRWLKKESGGDAGNTASGEDRCWSASATASAGPDLASSAPSWPSWSLFMSRTFSNVEAPMTTTRRLLAVLVVVACCCSARCGAPQRRGTLSLQWPSTLKSQSDVYSSRSVRFASVLFSVVLAVLPHSAHSVHCAEAPVETGEQSGSHAFRAYEAISLLSVPNTRLSFSSLVVCLSQVLTKASTRDSSLSSARMGSSASRHGLCWIIKTGGSGWWMTRSMGG